MACGGPFCTRSRRVTILEKRESRADIDMQAFDIDAATQASTHDIVASRRVDRVLVKDVPRARRNGRCFDSGIGQRIVEFPGVLNGCVRPLVEMCEPFESDRRLHVAVPLAIIDRQRIERSDFFPQVHVRRRH